MHLRHRRQTRRHQLHRQRHFPPSLLIPPATLAGHLYSAEVAAVNFLVNNLLLVLCLDQLGVLVLLRLPRGINLLQPFHPRLDGRGGLGTGCGCTERVQLGCCHREIGCAVTLRKPATQQCDGGGDVAMDDAAVAAIFAAAESE